MAICSVRVIRCREPCGVSMQSVSDKTERKGKREYAWPRGSGGGVIGRCWTSKQVRCTQTNLSFQNRQWQKFVAHVRGRLKTPVQRTGWTDFSDSNGRNRLRHTVSHGGVLSRFRYQNNLGHYRKDPNSYRFCNKSYTVQ